MEPEGLFLIGGISNSHGVRGEIKFRPVTEDVKLLKNLKEVTLALKGEWKVCKVLKSRAAKDHWIMSLEGYNDRDEADSLKMVQVYVDEEQIRPLEEDEFFIHDMIGSTVCSQEGEELGVIQGYFESGAQLIFEVTGENDFLFPATEEILLEIQAENKKVIIQVIEGLIELNKPKS